MFVEAKCVTTLGFGKASRKKNLFDSGWTFLSMGIVTPATYRLLVGKPIKAADSGNAVGYDISARNDGWRRESGPLGVRGDGAAAL